MSRVDTEPYSWPVSLACRITHEVLPSSLPAILPALALHFEISRLQFGLHAFEARLVVGGRAQRLAARQQEIAGKAVFHAHDFAHLAELADAFEQDHFHCRYSLI